jgi:membrane-bound lytic murein transglycosylase D
MSTQMQNYVPAFIAMNYVIAYYEDFGIKVESPLYSHYQVDTIMVFEKVEFSQISKSIDLDVKHLKYLNPRYRKSIIPASENGSVLVLPTDLLIEFVISQNEIFNSKEFKQKEKKEISKLNLISYKVNKGESLHKIAIKYKCTIEDIMLWNNLSINHVLKYGETLKIYR